MTAWQSADAHVRPSGRHCFMLQGRLQAALHATELHKTALQRPVGCGKSVTTIPQDLRMPLRALAQHTETNAPCAALHALLDPHMPPMSTRYRGYSLSTPRLGSGMCGAGRPKKPVLTKQVWPSSPEPLTAPKHASSVCTRQCAGSCASPMHGSWKGRAELQGDTRHHGIKQQSDARPRLMRQGCK